MIVKVSHSVELEEIPELINSILTRCRQTLNKQADRIAKVEPTKCYTGDLAWFNENIEQVRQKLSLVDSQLSDVAGLANGLAEAVSQGVSDDAQDGVVGDQDLE